MDIVESELGYKEQPVKTRIYFYIKTTIRKVQFSSVKNEYHNEQFVFRPQTELRKGNVFAGVCHSVQGKQVHHVYHGIGHMVGYPPRNGQVGTPLLLTSSGQPGYQTWDLLPPEQHLVVATEVRTVYKRAVRILLECFRVENKNISNAI